MDDKMKILGIDPGLRVCGYALFEVNRQDEKLLEAGVIRNSSKAELPERLNKISEDFTELLEAICPDTVAVEKLYSHYKHPRTAILMGHARGVILQKCGEKDIRVQSFSATRIKKSVTGNGRASKEQIQRAIQTTLGLSETPEPNDVADAISAALCCINHLKLESNMEFVK
jgi:crossover junction endodeoxyribonuclease RuvC